MPPKSLLGRLCLLVPSLPETGTKGRDLLLLQSPCWRSSSQSKRQQMRVSYSNNMTKCKQRDCRCLTGQRFSVCQMNGVFPTSWNARCFFLKKIWFFFFFSVRIKKVYRQFQWQKNILLLDNKCSRDTKVTEKDTITWLCALNLESGNTSPSFPYFNNCT